MRLRVNHTTKYRYPNPVTDSHNEVRLRPVSDDDQTCLEYSLKTTPAAKQFDFTLPTGIVENFGIRAFHQELVVCAESLVETRLNDPFVGMPFETNLNAFYSEADLKQDFAEYLAETNRIQFSPDIETISHEIARATQGGSIEFLQAVNRWIYREIAYRPGKTDVNTALPEVLEKRMGVCQDHAHIMLAFCRCRGVPSRYLSGYLYTGSIPISADVRQIASVADLENKRPALVSGDAMHAWVECLLPDRKWHGFDPTNNVLTDDKYIKVHYGRDYSDVPPIKGVFRGAVSHTLAVSVHVSLG